MSEQRVSFTLAHPLRTEDAEDLGLEPQVYQAGERLILNRREAMRLVGAGYVLGAEPSKPATVQAALTPVKTSPAVKPALGKAETGKSE
ncbi:hypothetical protein ACWCSD_31855 [Nonomuraea sp. NPDC001684]